MRSKKIRLMLSWSLISSLAIGAYWLIYYLVTGRIPVYESIGMLVSRNGSFRPIDLALLSGMSHLFDLFIGPMIVAIAIYMIRCVDHDNKEDKPMLWGTMWISLVLGIATGLPIVYQGGLAISGAILMFYILVVCGPFDSREWRTVIGGFLLLCCGFGLIVGLPFAIAGVTAILTYTMLIMGIVRLGRVCYRPFARHF